MGEGLRFECQLKIYFPEDSREPLKADTVLWQMQCIKVRAGDILRPGHEELHTFDGLA